MSVILDKMNINLIKERLTGYIGKDLVIRYNIGRNKIEKYDVRIKTLYNNVFVVEQKNNSVIKSFSYSDIITKIIKIDEK